MGYREKGPC
uniref:Uncharacterized protein n=1 Tax=Rhizophora mucronata TaxID=61149 RepID=A0A2P2PX21_RHIMU